MRNLQVTFKNLENQSESLQVNLVGRLNEMNAIDFKQDLMRILKNRNSDCQINIQSLTALDVIGVNALAMAHRELELKGMNLSIVSKKESEVDRAFRMTKFDRILNLVRA